MTTHEATSAVPLKQVVIVDDSAEFRQVLALHLDALDICVVAEADEHRSGLVTVAETVPDLVVTDLQMPVADGIWLTRHIRLAHPDLPIIMATGSKSSTQLMKQALEAGVTALVSKHDGAAVVAAMVQHQLAAPRQGR